MHVCIHDPTLGGFCLRSSLTNLGVPSCSESVSASSYPVNRIICFHTGSMVYCITLDDFSVYVCMHVCMYVCRYI